MSSLRLILTALFATTRALPALADKATAEIVKDKIERADLL